MEMERLKYLPFYLTRVFFDDLQYDNFIDAIKTEEFDSAICLGKEKPLSEQRLELVHRYATLAPGVWF
jgi:hypothetical protein